MTHYMIALTTVHDRSKLAEYAARVHEVVPKFNGEFVREGPVTHMLENSLPVGGQEVQTAHIMRFPDAQAALDFYNSPEYVELRDFRHDMATSAIFLLGEFPAPG